jgi:uncharacterized membrane protein YbhN (UPF0104 family)
MMPSGIRMKVAEVNRKIRRILDEPLFALRIFALSLVIQSARIMTHYLAARALGIEITPIAFFLAVPMIAVVAGLPISLGGLGIREQTGVILFTLFGMSALQAFSVELIAYLIAIITSIPGGLLFIFRKSVTSQAEPILETT